mmetsp:Transcript_3416/g.5322  ORF Transcript_3416/g.5322 Transcript_3416/m.5322 type:complete len:116 (+) Transcript_3416:72-419(+)
METTPRITGKMMPNFLGRTVLLMCDCSSLGQSEDGASIIVQSTDGARVAAYLPAGETIESTTVQFLAKVVKQDTIQVLSMSSPSLDVNGTPFNVEQYNTAVSLMHNPKFSHLFAQ